MANDDVLETGSFPSGPGLKNLACNARDTSSIPGKIPHAAIKSLHATTKDPACHS